MTGTQSLLSRSALLQLAVICACWGVGEAVSRVLGLRLPGSLIGMGLLLAMLVTGVVRISSMRKGTQLLLADMLLFFVPAVPAVVDHPEFMGLLGLKLAAILLIGTALVLGVTAASVTLAGRIMRHAP